MSSTGFAPLSLWLRKSRKSRRRRNSFLLLLCKINNNTITSSFRNIFRFAGALLCADPEFWNMAFISKIPFIRLCFHQHYNINVENFISTHVCLVSVAFSVRGSKFAFRWTREVHTKQKTNYARERGISTKKRGQIHQRYQYFFNLNMKIVFFEYHNVIIRSSQVQPKLNVGFT